MNKHPPVLILMCDQMQFNRMGFMDGLSRTPNLDQLASQSTHFTNAFTCQGQCVPSRASFITGQPAHQCGVMVNYGFYDHQNMLTGSLPTLYQSFKKAGYDTIHFGKRHLGNHMKELGIDFWNEHDDRMVTDREDLEHIPPKLRNNVVSTEEAVEWLEKYQPGDTPLCFTYSTNLPHPPFYREPEFDNLWNTESLPVPSSMQEETFSNKPDWLREHSCTDHGIRSPQDAQSMLHDYLTMIALMDKHIGAVINSFKQKGLWDDTLVIFLADHGDMMGSHGLRVKGTLPYDELYRIPLLIKLPTGSPSKPAVDTLVSSDCFAATLLELADIPIPNTFTGQSVKPLIFGEKAEGEEEVFFEHYAAYWGIHPFYGIRTRKFKAVRFYGDEPFIELYDLEKDPDELNNVAAAPEYSSVRDNLLSRADNWWAKTGGKTFEYYESDYFRNNEHNKTCAPIA